jgi:hypothetical protein
MKCTYMLRGVLGGALTLTLGLAALAPAALASPAAKHTVTYKFTTTKLLWTGSQTIIVATDAHGDLEYFSKAAGSTTWHEQVVAKAKNGVSYSKPAIAWNGHIFIAAVNKAGALVYFVRSGGAWREHVLAQADLGGRLPWQAPSVTSTPGGGLLVTDGNDGGTFGVLQSWDLAPGASQWNELLVSSGNFGASSAGTITARFSLNGTLGLVTTSAGGTVYFWWEYLNAPTWRKETIASPGSQGKFSTGAITSTASNIVVSAPTASGAVDSWYQSDGGTTWTQQSVTGAGHPGSHLAISWFAQTGMQAGKTVTHTYGVIAGIGRGGQLDLWWQLEFAVWHEGTIAKAGKQAAYGSPGISVNGSDVIVTAVNTKSGNLMFWYQPYGASAWHMQVVAKG